MYYNIQFHRFYFHQVNVGIGLLTTVRNDLQNVIAVCEQVKKPTNYLRSVMNDLMKGTIIFRFTDFFTDIFYGMVVFTLQSAVCKILTHKLTSTLSLGGEGEP
jgi:hypothetical protein